MKKLGVILMAMVLSLTILAGCGSSQKVADSLATYDQVTEVVMEGKAETAVQVPALGEDVENVASQDIQLSLASDLNRKIIKKGNLEIETKQFDQTINDIFKKIEAEGGFVENCDISGSSLYASRSYRHANMTVRMPQKAFDMFINTADRFGNIVRRGIEAQDITDVYVDTETRMKTLEVRRDRLMALMEQSGSLEELFKIEQELANVNYEIETLKGTLDKYDSLIDFATIQITVSEVERYKEMPKPVTFGEKIIGTFKNSIRSLAQLGKGFVLVVVAAVPYLIVIGVPIGIVILIWRKMRRKNRNKDK